VEHIKYWTVAPKWKGQPAFIIAGGTSVTPEMLEMVRGRNVIAVNQSYQKALWAPIMFFADQRWWVREARERPDQLRAFKGIISTTSRQAKDLQGARRLLRLRRISPEDVVPEKPNIVRLRRTGLLSAMDICYHRGASEIILLGADNRDGDDGRAHHHEEYPWPRPKNSWDVKVEDFRKGAKSFKDVGLPITNCSPITTLRFWPVRPLGEVLDRIDTDAKR
jgi:hypothetical protein